MNCAQCGSELWPSGGVWTFRRSRPAHAPGRDGRRWTPYCQTCARQQGLLEPFQRKPAEEAQLLGLVLKHQNPVTNHGA